MTIAGSVDFSYDGEIYCLSFSRPTNLIQKQRYQASSGYNRSYRSVSQEQVDQPQ